MAILNNKNTLMADTGGGGTKTTTTKTTTTTKPANAYTDTGTKTSGTGNKTTTTGTKTTTTTTTPKTTTTTTTPKTTTTTTKPAGTPTTVTHADGSVSTAYLVNGHTVDANGNAYQFKNGDQVKTAGGTYTVNNGVGTKNETTNNTSNNKTTTTTVTKPSTTTNTGGTVTKTTDTGTKTAGTGNKTSTTGTKTVTTTTPQVTPKVTTTTPQTSGAVSTAANAVQSALNTPASTPASTTPATISQPTTTIERYTDTGTGKTYDELMNEYNNLTSQQNELLAAKAVLDATKAAQGTADAVANASQNGSGNNMLPMSIIKAEGGEGAYIMRNGQKVPGYIIDGKVYDQNNQPFAFQEGDTIKQGSQTYVMEGGQFKLVPAPESTANTAGANPVASTISNAGQTVVDIAVEAARQALEGGAGGGNGGGGAAGAGGAVGGSNPELAVTYAQGNASDNAGGAGAGGGQPGSNTPKVDYGNMSDSDLINYIMNAIETGDEAALRDFMTWAEAEAIARERMNPLYNQYIDQQMKNIDLKALQGGFYGQLPTEALRQQALAATEGDRTQAIIDYATQLLNADREGVLEDARLGLDERQQKINTLMNLLESNRALSEAEKDRELKKYIADQDSINTQGKLANDMDQFNRELEYKYWLPTYQYNTTNVNKK